MHNRKHGLECDKQCGEHNCSLRECKKCRKEKCITLFKKSKECLKGYRYACKECINDKNRMFPLDKGDKRFCRKCSIYKCITEFLKASNCFKGYRYTCKDCKNKEYIKKGPCKNNPSWFKEGKEHPNYIDGNWKIRSKFEKGSQFQRIRKIVLKRDKFRCQICNKKERLHVHHIVPLRVNMNLAYDLNNLITLCPKCHATEEKKTR